MIFLTYIQTIRHLRPIQIYYRLWYMIRKIWYRAINYKYPLTIEKNGDRLNLQPFIDKPDSYSDGTFTFLNISEEYPAGNIKRNDACYSRLWLYNYNYMDFLLQKKMNKAVGLKLIDDFIKNLRLNSTGIEPYTIAIRGVNWIKFLANTLNTTVVSHEINTSIYKSFANESGESMNIDSISKKRIDSSLYAQYKILSHNLEYHLLANHIMEDGISLLFAAFYFKDEEFYRKSKTIFESELQEQILKDGAHFELSPMYHQIILDRLLDCINLLQNNERFSDQEKLLMQIKDKAEKMLSWINRITFSNGQIPLFNDAAHDIAPTTHQLNQYALTMNLNPATSNSILSDSGYRIFTSPFYECIIDIGLPGPSYQPGHSHADTFNYVMNIFSEAFIVDTGISTYEVGETRLKERGTSAHNTVTVADKNSSKIWSSFRVAHRARVKILNEDKNRVTAQHNGYRSLGTIHQRDWRFSEKRIYINDSLSGKNIDGIAHLWLDPHINPVKDKNSILTGTAIIYFENASSVKLIQTQIPNGYNRFSDTCKIEISFQKQLKTVITIQ